MSYSYRKIGLSELKKYREFRFLAFKNSPESFSDHILDEIEYSDSDYENIIGFTESHFTMGCFNDDQDLVGVVTFKRDLRTKGKHKSYIYTMYVDEKYRGKKIAKNLLSNIISLAREMQDLEQIHLWVLNPEVSSAKQLYLKCGWRPQGIVVKNDLKIDNCYVDAEYMVLNLQNNEEI